MPHRRATLDRRHVISAVVIAAMACGADATAPASPPSPATSVAASPAASSPAEASPPTSAAVASPATPAAAPTPSCDRCTGSPCDPADARACDDLAQDVLHARGVTYDRARYGDLEQRACEGGYAPACSMVGMLYQDGLGRPHSDVEAAKWHGRACEAGAGIGCYNLANMIGGGEHTTADPELAATYYVKALAAFERACEAGDAQWCANVGFMYESGLGTSADEARAFAAYERGCPGHANPCINLALGKLSGRGIKQDPEGAMTLLEQGCAGGSTYACAFFGHELWLSPVTSTSVKGVQQLTAACDANEAMACGWLAMALEAGRGTATDAARALQLLGKACQLGDGASCSQLVDRLLERKQRSDTDLLRQSLTTGCQINDTRACGMLSFMIENRAFGEPDAAQLHELRVVGCRMGDLDACAWILERGEAPDVLPARVEKVRAHACAKGVKAACDGTAAAAP